MRVSETMTSDVHLAEPNQTLKDVARIMCDNDIGALPVRENDRLIGMITDRDIAVRAVANGQGPDTLVRDAMTTDIKYCFEDEDIEHVIRNMGDQQIRRLPVLNRQKRLVGVLALCDVAASCDHEPVGDALSQISRPGGAHTQADGALH